jgi:hypothetical protein
VDLRQQTGRINGLGIDRAGALWSLHPPPFDCLIFGPNMEKLEARSGHRLFYWPLFYYFVLAPRTICRPPSGGKARKMRQGWMDACCARPLTSSCLEAKETGCHFNWTASISIALPWSTGQSRNSKNKNGSKLVTFLKLARSMHI